MKNRMDWMTGKNVGVALCLTMLMSVPVVADEANAIRAVKMDPEKLAGINLPVEEPFMAPVVVVEGNHRPRGEVLHYGEQLITEIYEDDALTWRIDEPVIYDEFVLVLSGKLILTGTDGVSLEFVAGDSLVVPNGFAGTWQMLGNYRELIVIERNAYEEAWGAPPD